MNSWFIDPRWQNFSSLYREAVAAREAPNEIGRSHHLTSSLYFGIASLEAFLNRSMRAHLASRANEESIFKKLRHTDFLTKLERWPKEILQVTPSLADTTMDLLRLLYEVRGDLIHPKTRGHDTYRKLETVDPESVLMAVAEFIVRFFEARREVFPYWLFGWNYLNPRPDSHEIVLINNQQFSHSLLNMGFQLPAWDAVPADAWREQNMSSLSGFQAIKRTLDGLDHCEPKDPRFPFQPTLCRRWWTDDHCRTCGHVSEEALRRALQGGA